MNERIKQLWEDSEEIKVRYPEQGSPVSVSEQTLEKFAELIVRECYLWSKENGGLGCEEDFEALKEHLGVKE
jgi:hypothetical protein